MSEIDNGGPAFPHMKRPRPDLGTGVTETITDGGMSLRDWFAGQALPALISYDDYLDYSAAAVHAYKHADAMLEARKVQP
jgi:hypothetical protein